MPTSERGVCGEDVDNAVAGRAAALRRQLPKLRPWLAGQWQQHRWRSLAVLLLLAMLSWFAGPSIVGRIGLLLPLSSKDQAHMSVLTEQLHTRYFGRYQVDLPADAKLSGTYTLDGHYVVSTVPMPNRDHFTIAMRKREREISSDSPGDSDSPAFNPKSPDLFREDIGHLLVEKPAIGMDNTMVFLRLESETYGKVETRPGTQDFVIEGYRWVGGVMFKVQTKTFDKRFSVFDMNDGVDRAIAAFPDTTPEYLQHTLALLRQLQPLPHAEQPPGPGFSIGHAYLPGPVGKEKLELLVRMPGFPTPGSVTLNFSIEPAYRGDDPDNSTLLHRLRDIAPGNPVYLRTGTREIHGLPLDEVIVHVPEPYPENGAQAILQAEWAATQDIPTQPDIVIKGIIRGVVSNPAGYPPKYKAALSDKAAILAWDTWLATFKRRDNAD